MIVHRRALLAAPALIPFAAHAAWPERPVTIIVPFGPGSANDVLARLIAPHLTRAWGQPVVVNNVVGAAGTIGVDRVAKSAPDGLTIALAADAAIVVRVSMSPRPPYDPLTDLAPISQLGRTPNILVVSNATPYTGLAQIVAAARARPGTLSFAHIGAGTSQHIGGELLNQMAGIELTGVAYNDGGAQLQDVIAGRATMTFNNVVVVAPRLRDGSFRALGVSSPERIPTLPDIPTIAEQGYPGFNATAWLGLFGRAGTPPEIIARIRRDAVAAMAQPDVAPRLTELGIQVVGNTPEELATLMRREIPRMAQVLERAGLRSPVAAPRSASPNTRAKPGSRTVGPSGGRWRRRPDIRDRWMDAGGAGRRDPGRWLGREHPVELARAVQRHQVVATADVLRADEDLRHRAPPARSLGGDPPGFAAMWRVVLGERHALAAQQCPGAVAIGAEDLGVDLDLGHFPPSWRGARRPSSGQNHSITIETSASPPVTSPAAAMKPIKSPPGSRSAGGSGSGIVGS